MFIVGSHPISDIKMQGLRMFWFTDMFSSKGTYITDTQ